MEKAPHNQISKTGKIIGGVLLCFFTLSVLMLIIAFWPDKLPASGKMARYERRLFNVTLLDSACINPLSTKSNIPDKKPVIKKAPVNIDTTQKNSSTAITVTNTKADLPGCIIRVNINDTIQFNTVMLLLVALTGFLGNMVHIASSFTNFIGAGQFKRSWILWYCVKPFTASALALIVYFAFRAGFLNANDPGNTLNIYGIMTISALTGLFTDVATQKLKEVFEVIFRPKEGRPDSLENTK